MADGAGSRHRRGGLRSPVAVFALGFLLLMGGVAAVAYAQFEVNTTAAWVSIGCSAGAVVLTLMALSIRSR